MLMQFLCVLGQKMANACMIMRAFVNFHEENGLNHQNPNRRVILKPSLQFFPLTGSSAPARYCEGFK